MYVGHSHPRPWPRQQADLIPHTSSSVALRSDHFIVLFFDFASCWSTSTLTSFAQLAPGVMMGFLGRSNVALLL
jgi:hypothetical protein